VADHVYHALSRKRWETVWLWPNGKHEFSYLRHLLQNDRSKAVRLLNTALMVAAPARPAQPVRQPRIRRRLADTSLGVQARRFRRDPSGYFVRAYVVLRLFARNRTYRRVAGRYVMDRRLRSGAQAHMLLGDLLRLDVLARQCAHPNGSVTSVHLDATNGHRWYVTTAHGPNGFAAHANGSSASSMRVIWDNSAVSTTCRVPVAFGKAIDVSLGPSGVYEFNFLGVLHQIDRQLAESLLPAPAE
jgi:hypothetical protein